VTLKINTNGVGGKFSKSAVVHSNDPQQPKTEISLSCTVKQYISITPAYRINLVGYEGEKVSTELTITSLEEQPLKITDITTTVKDKIKYTLKTLVAGKEYRLIIKNRSTQEGLFQGELVLKTTSQKRPQVIIPVFGTLKGKVSVLPKALSFGIIDTSRGDFKGRLLKRSVVLKDARGDGLTIKKIKSSRDWINVETSAEENRKEFTVKVTLNNDKLPKGKIEEKLYIHTNYKKKPLVVDIVGEVR